MVHATQLGPGHHVGSYRLVRRLGAGASATTFEAQHLQRGERVALKALSLEPPGDWTSIERLRREAATLERLCHPGIPRYLDHVESDGVLAMVQELAPGESLAKRVEGGWRAAEDDVWRLAEGVATILAYLHGLLPPVVHRDVSPANIVMGTDGRVWLVDFGAARIQGGTLTMTGTPGYIAPEQLAGAFTPASDVYGLGATLTYLITHRSPAELPRRRLRLDPRMLTGVDPGLARLVARMLEPVPEDRPRSGLKVLERVRRLRARQTRAGSVKRAATVILAVATAAGLASTVWLAGRMHEPWTKPVSARPQADARGAVHVRVAAPKDYAVTTPVRIELAPGGHVHVLAAAAAVVSEGIEAGAEGRSKAVVAAIVLRNAAGESIRLEPVRPLSVTSPGEGWTTLDAPIEGSAEWRRTGSASGTATVLELRFEARSEGPYEFWVKAEDAPP